MNVTTTKESRTCLGISKSEPYHLSSHRGDVFFRAIECYNELTGLNARYFSQRYSIFSLYDDGVCMTDDAWFGVTPEPVAKYV
jgi:hypothetical protein